MPVAQETGDDRNRLLEAADAVVEGIAEGDVFRLVPAGTQSEDEATTADLLDGVGHLGQQRGVTKRRGHDQRTDLWLFGDRRQRRDERPALPHATRLFAGYTMDEVIGDPERVGPDLLPELGHLAQIAPARGAAIHLAFRLGKDHPDL